MSETNTESSAVDPAAILSESPSSSTQVLLSSSPSKTVDDEIKRRKILSKLWGKGNKLSHKVRELDKSTVSNSSDLSIHNDQQQLADNSNNLLSHSSTNDPKSSTEDSSNSISSSKPLAVVKPIVVVKSGLMVSSAADRTRVNSEASSTTITQTDGTTTTTVTERQSSSSTTTDRTSSKKKKNHKNEDSKKKKTTRDKSNERDRSQHHHHHIDENSSKKDSSSSKNHRREQDENIAVKDNHHKSSRYPTSSTTSSSNHRRRSLSNDIDHTNQRSGRSTLSRKDEPSSSKKSTLSPVDHHRHSSSKHETSTNHNHSSHRHRRSSSRTPSPSLSRSRHSTTNGDRRQTKKSSSPKKDDRSSTTTTKTVSNSKSTNSISPSDSYTNHRGHGLEAATNHDSHRHKTRTSEEQLTNSSKSQDISPDHHYHRSSSKQEKPKTITNNDENNSNRQKPSSSRHDQRSHSRHRSRSKEEKTNRKTIEPSNSDDNSLNKTKTNHEKDSTTVNENATNEKKSSRGSSIPSTHGDRRRKSPSDYHRYDRHDTPSRYDRRSDYHRRHRVPSPRSYYPSTHYVHHHHHHHYRSTSSRYRHHRRSVSPRSNQYRSRYFSSTSSSLSPSSRRRRSPSRTSSSYSRSSSSYSSISRTSSSRSSSRNHHYYHNDKKYRRSPTLEKLFLKASESIESVSTTKNPNASSSTHLIPIQTSTTTSDVQMSSPMNSLSEPNTFYPDSFSGFSAPPPPFMAQPQQRCLKEITTQSPTSRRFVLNELQTPIQSSNLSTIDGIISIKTTQSNDLPTNVRSGSSRPPRVSRFSDIVPAGTSEPALNTNISVDTPLNYSQISENINCLPSSRRQQKRHNREVMECECTTSEYDRSRGIKACGYECLNRMLLIECSTNCPCGHWCTNRRFQRRSYADHKLALFKTEMKGYGLRTISSIRKGRFLVEYVGEVIDMDELARRNKKYKRDGNIHQYVMSLIHGTVIDSTIKGNWARYINHSCEPNCSAEKWLVNGEYRMGIFAKRDLDADEEITIDYRFETFGAVDLANEKCYCGAPTCRGTISLKSKNHLNKRTNRRQPLDDDELIDYLRDDDTNEYIVPKTIEEIRQLIQIMSRTDSENVRTIELDLIRNNSQKQFELPRLFLECNGLHVLCSWMKDILIEDDEHQQYSDEFKYHLLDFIHSVLPIKDRTTVIKNGLLDLVYKKLKLPLSITDNIDDNNTDQEQINQLMNSILDHLDNPIIAKLFHIYSTWMSLKERYIIPKRKEPQQISSHHHRHHHHHSSKHSYEENNDRFKFSTRSSTTQQKPIDRPFERRSFVMRDAPRTQEQQLSKDERRKLFEQQYEDEEKARAAAAAAATNGESPGGQNEPPYKKQRTSDSTEPLLPSTSPHSQTSSMPHSHQTDQTHFIHQHLSQIPIEYIRSYMTSIGQSVPLSSTLTGKDEPPLPPPPRPNDENELSRIIHLPPDWSVAMCPSDSSVYYYNRQTMTTSWTPPSLGTPTENSTSLPSALDLSPLSSAHINEQRRPHHELSSSSRLAMKLSKHPHRHSRSHRHHYSHHHMNSNNKRKRPSDIESTTVVKEEPHSQSTEEPSMIISNQQIKQEDAADEKPIEQTGEMSLAIPKTSLDENDELDMSTTVKESSEINDNIDEQIPSNDNTLSSSAKLNRDVLRKNISQHVHATLKPYTKRTCKQGRIVSTDDIKYLVKKFTLAVLDKEIEKAKNEGSLLSPILTDRVRLKTEVYVKKYMNKVGSVFQRHDTTVHPSSQSSQQMTTTTTTLNAE